MPSRAPKSRRETPPRRPATESGRTQQLQALFRIASILVGPGPFCDNARQMLDVMVGVVNADRAVLRLPDVESGDLLAVAGAGPLIKDHPPATIKKAHGGLSNRAFDHNEVVIEQEHVPGGRTGRIIEGVGVRSTIAMPIVSGEKVTGVLIVGSWRPHFFSPEAVELLTAITGALGALIENARLRESLEVERALRVRVDNFVSIASHELRTPMTTLVGYSELLLMDEPRKDVRREWFEVIHAESKRLTEILDELLDISRINAGTVRVNLQVLALPPLIRELVRGLELASPNHQFELEEGNDVPDVIADRDRLLQVLGNLLDNAVKYSPEGGKISVSFRLDEERSRVITSVCDQGIGIAPRDRARVFEMFQRARAEEAVTIRGTGLGLHVVKSLVELMGGAVWVRSRRHHGSTFSFALPTGKHLPGEGAPPPPLPRYDEIAEFAPGPPAMGALLPGASVESRFERVHRHLIPKDAT